MAVSVLTGTCLLAPAVADGSTSPSDTATASSSGATDSTTGGTGSAAASDTSVPTDPTTTGAASSTDSVPTDSLTPTDGSGSSTSAGASSATTSVAPGTSGASSVAGGEPASVSTTVPTQAVLPSAELMRQAVNGLVLQEFGQVPSSAVDGATRSGLLHDTAAAATANCHCTIALSVAFNGDAYALAQPNSLGSATAGAATTVAGPPADGVPGATGNATSVTFNFDGPASASAASGTVGGDAGSASTASAPGTTVSDYQQPAGLASGFVQVFGARLLAANATVATTLSMGTCGAACVGYGSASVEIATLPSCPDGTVCTSVTTRSSSAPSGVSCWAADRSTRTPGGPWCTIAIAVSMGGTAHAGVLSPVSSAVPAGPAACSPGLAGGSAAVAIAAGGDARALSRMGAVPACTTTPVIGSGAGAALAPAAVTVVTSTTPAPPSAPSRTGSTGNALGLALSAHGASTSTTWSGNSGRIRAGSTAAAAGGSTAGADTGSTGDAVGIAIARDGSSTLVHSGNSGEAAAVCTNCSGATTPNGGNAIAVSSSGDTGLSFSLAVAGLVASVRSESGDSGNSIAVAMDGVEPGSGSTGNSSDRALVAGRSGKTGDTVVVAIGLTTWIDMWTWTGRSGPVVSLATWGANGCTLVVATLSAQCPKAATVPPKLPGTPADPGSPALVPTTATGSILDPQVVAAGLWRNAPVTVSSVGETEMAAGSTVPATQDRNVAAGADVQAVPVAVSAVRSPAPKSEGNQLAGLGTAMLVTALVVLAWRFGGRNQGVNTS